MKIGIADYGMNVWDGGCHDLEQRLLDLKEIGYDGIERLECIGAADAIERACTFHRLGMDFGTVRILNNPQSSMQYAAAFGKSYVWTMVNGRDLPTFCRQVNKQIEAAGKYGINVCLHNHLGQAVESQDNLDEFMAACPKAKLIFDTGHMAGAGGDCVKVVEDYADRIHVLHLKDFVYKNESLSLDRWPDRLRFCELGAGEMGDVNAKVIQAAVEAGFDGWVFVEHDTHLQEPVKDLAISRDYLRKAGF